MQKSLSNNSWRSMGWLLSAVLCILGMAQIAGGMIVPVKAMAAQVLLERAFDQSVATRSPKKPWPWADMAPVARVSVPRLGIDQVVLDSGSGQAMAFAPTLLPESSRLGQPGTTVIAAHRDTHFRFLEHVRKGDLIDAETLDGTVHHYRVDSTEIVRWDRFAVPSDNPGGALALATCYPFGALDHGPLRYVVHADPVGATADDRKG